MIAKLATEYPVTEACAVLAVSRSGYQRWRDDRPGIRAQANLALAAQIQEIHAASRKTYGSPRITRALHHQGVGCGHNRVARIMRQEGLCGAQKRRFRPRTTDSRHADPVSPNHLKTMTVIRPDQAWVADITYIPTQEGFVYLAGVMDLCSRQIKGWALQDSLHTELVSAAFLQAYFKHSPQPGLVFHSDRGCQYASRDFRVLLEQHKLVSSMSRTGNCYDNAAMESFWATLKTELIQKPFKTKKEAQLAIFDYIEIFYNRKRIHSALGFRSPVDFESSLCHKSANTTNPTLYAFSGEDHFVGDMVYALTSH